MVPLDWQASHVMAAAREASRVELCFQFDPIDFRRRVVEICLETILIRGCCWSSPED